MPSEHSLIQNIQTNVDALQQALSDARFWQKQFLEQAESDKLQRVADSNSKYQQRLAAIRSAYESVLYNVGNEIDESKEEAGYLAASWQDEIWQTWTPTLHSTAPEVTRIGQLAENGKWHKLVMPATIPFFGNRGLLLKTSGAARDASIKSIQSFLLRLIATLPPGKLKFVFLDPIGLGQNVAAFMQLADYDEQLVTGKAWTEPNHIEQRLADLTEQMENVIQKYLRNQFATIEEYNQDAGEVAEPYRILVVMDFPANFSETAARRLVSIAQNGPRCGVYTIVLADISKPTPYGFNLVDLERASTVIVWDGNRFVWQDEDFKDCFLELDAPPDKELFDRIIQSVGAATKEASKVEVPFTRMFDLFSQQIKSFAKEYPGLNDAPNPLQSSTWWRGETDKRLIAPLGRSGAKKVQCLDLGKATAQHALIAGKTGSGKSTLLHTLITSVALTYSPDELELYLIDFKKGVEFKTYAANQLPHARVIAIESEREFGLSVLQGLDDELKHRGDLFRKLQVDELGDYREKSGQTLPRVLLLVDEFQEFFTDDDPIASQSAQIMDRLVRQGRAFGMHIILGSQTLAGAYSLARSTIDQMAVRIALQCSEADSRLILADDNPAARLLSRPGEAIYNSSNGTVEGNNRFQVALLNDDQHDRYLAQIQEFAKKTEHFPPQSQLIFEGNAPAEIEKNRPLHDALTASPMLSLKEGTRVSAHSAWLGEPIAIRPPIAATFRRQSGSNLLIVGTSDETALGMTSIALISLAAQNPAPSFQSSISTLNVLDFGAVDGANANFFVLLNEHLGNTINLGRRREVVPLIEKLAHEMQRRIDGAAGGAPIYLFIYGLQRARDLRQEETMNFSFDADASPAPNPAQQFNLILREGPDVGIFTIVWCDNLTNLNRVIDRRALREFGLRVVMQMNAEDSANLIDTPAASKLGAYRALYYSEEEGRLEKFRPYGLPSKKWLEWAGKLLREKATTVG